MNKPLVTVIIVTYNSHQDIQACLEAVLRSTNVDLEVIVADNASTDGTPELVRQTFPAVHLVEHEANLGFAEANNRAMRLAQGDFVFLLNADAVVAADAIAILAKRMASDPQIAVLAPKMLFLQEPCVINSAGLQSNRIFYTCDRGFLEYDRGQYDEEAEVIGACGGAMFVRRSIIQELGLFDDRYFMYYEDIDFCIRAWIAGYKVMYTPEAIVYHRMRASGRSEYLNEYVDHRNRLRTLLKNCSPPSVLKLLPRSLAFDLGCVANHLRQGRSNAARLRLKALGWNLMMLPDLLAWRGQINRLRRASDQVVLNLLSPDSGYPRINAPLPTYIPLYSSTLDSANLTTQIEMDGQAAQQLGLGWYGPEMWNGTPIRWTNHYAIAFLAKPWPDPANLIVKYVSPVGTAGELLVNDAYLCDYSGKAHEWTTIQHRVDCDSSALKVTLLLESTFNPRQDLGASDDRNLGIAVSSIAIKVEELIPSQHLQGRGNVA